MITNYMTNMITDTMDRRVFPSHLSILRLFIEPLSHGVNGALFLILGCGVHLQLNMAKV